MQKKIPLMIVLILVILITGVLLGMFFSPKKIVEVEKIIKFNPSYFSSKEITLVGVDNLGKGVVAKMSVNIKEGTGLVLVNINNTLADYLTQLSARRAAKIASEVTNKSINNLDLIYNLKTNAGLIEGPSAGAAMTLATIAGLQNKTINQSVIITGTIEEDGSINIVGGINEKAQAAKLTNATLFLIPEGRYNVGYEEIKKCKEKETVIYCEIDYLPKEIDIEKELGIKTIQVKNITEAVKYIIT